MELIDLEKFKKTSYRAHLQALYRRLDTTALSYDLGKKCRMEFARAARGEFIAALRLKRNVPAEYAATFLNVNVEILSEIESGSMRISDAMFFRVCAWLGGANEVSVFIEKLDKALVPGLREARKSGAKSLQVFGVTFADEDPR